MLTINIKVLKKLGKVTPGRVREGNAIFVRLGLEV